MKIYDDIIQGSEAWFAVRSGKVTSSNFAAAISKGKGSLASVGRNKLMVKLAVERERGTPLTEESYSNKAMELGSETEQEAREYYEAIHGPVLQVGFIERDEDVGCSPDGLVGDNGMLEIKCPLSTTHAQYLLADKMPTDYIAQVQGQLWVAGREWCDFFSFDPRSRRKKVFRKRVYRDKNYIKELHIKIIMFVNDLKDMYEKLTEAPF